MALMSRHPLSRLGWRVMGQSGCDPPSLSQLIKSVKSESSALFNIREFPDRNRIYTSCKRVYIHLESHLALSSPGKPTSTPRVGFFFCATSLVSRSAAQVSNSTDRVCPAGLEATLPGGNCPKCGHFPCQFQIPFKKYSMTADSGHVRCPSPGMTALVRTK